MSKSDMAYLRHIFDEVNYLNNETQRITAEQFYKDETRKRAFVRSLEIIGETTKNLSEAFRHAHHEIDWRALAGMRDKLIHGYFGVDYQIVWDVAHNKCPELQEKLIEIIGKD